MGLPNVDIHNLPVAPDFRASDELAIFSILRGRTERITAELLLGGGGDDADNPSWQSTFAYSEGNIVLYANEFWESDDGGNIGHLPNEDGSIWWHVVSKSFSGKDWAAGVFVEKNAIVFYTDVDDIVHSLRLASAVVLPFSSADLKAEYIAGTWQRMYGATQLMKTKFTPANSLPGNIGSGPDGLVLNGDRFIVDTSSTDGNGRDLIVDCTVEATADNPGSNILKWKINNG